MPAWEEKIKASLRERCWKEMCGFSFKVGVLFWSGEGPFTLSSLILFFPLSCLSDWFDLFFESSVNYKYAYSPQVSQQSGPEFQGHFQLTGKLKNVNEVKVCTIKKTTGQMWMKTTPTPSLMVLPRVMTVRIPGRVGRKTTLRFYYSHISAYHLR